MKKNIKRVTKKLKLKKGGRHGKKFEKHCGTVYRYTFYGDYRVRDSLDERKNLNRSRKVPGANERRLYERPT